MLVTWCGPQSVSYSQTERNRAKSFMLGAITILRRASTGIINHK